jgi:hypothetical protein
MFLRRSEKNSVMNKIFLVIVLIICLPGCKNKTNEPGRIALATVGSKTLYYDQVPRILSPGTSATDSIAIMQNYVNSWARKELLFLKAEENLSDENKAEIESQLTETRANLFIYQYQRQMMVEKMDTTISDDELEAYYSTNEKKFMLSSNIVKALFIKVPSDVPNLDRIRQWSRSSDQKDLQQLESVCYQFAEKFDDFNEEWVTMDRISVELPQEIFNQDEFLKYNTAYETRDSSSVYLITFRDFRLRYSLAPYDYVKNDIKNIILNNRRFEFLQNLENGIYNEGIKANLFKTF